MDANKVTISFLISVLAHSAVFAYLFNAEPEKIAEPKKAKKIEFIALAKDEKKVAQKKESKKVPQKNTQPKQIVKNESQKSAEPSLFSAQKEEPKPQSKEIKEEQKETKEASNPKVSEEKVAQYLSYLRRHLENNLLYPQFAKKIGLEGSVVVCFCVKANGSVPYKSIKIQKSSGYQILDKQAIETVTTSAPFEKAPPEEMEVVVPVTFSIKT